MLTPQTLAGRVGPAAVTPGRGDAGPRMRHRGAVTTSPPTTATVPGDAPRTGSTPDRLVERHRELLDQALAASEADPLGRFSALLALAELHDTLSRTDEAAACLREAIERDRETFDRP